MCCTEVIGNVLKFPPLTFFRFKIPRQRLIVVRSTLDYGVRVIAVRQMLVETVATERKLNDLHARMQDVLKLDNWARMNTPGTLGENWRWRLVPGQFTDERADYLSWLVDTFGRF